MNTDPDHNPPAFPRTGAEHIQPQSGMELRDYFAAKALPELIREALDLNHEKWDATAAHAYIIADAMLNERTRS